MPFQFVLRITLIPKFLCGAGHKLGINANLHLKRIIFFIHSENSLCLTEIPELSAR